MWCWFCDRSGQLIKFNWIESKRKKDIYKFVYFVVCGVDFVVWSHVRSSSSNSSKRYLKISGKAREWERVCVCVRERVCEWLVDVLSHGTYEHTFHSAYYLAISQCSLCCCALCCVCTVHLLAPAKIPLYVTR